MMNLPIYQGRKQDQQVREARFRRKAAKAQYEVAKQQIFLELQRLYIDAQTHQEEAVLFRTAIIPQAGQSLAAAMSGYQVDKGSTVRYRDPKAWGQLSVPARPG